VQPAKCHLAPKKNVGRVFYSMADLILFAPVLTDYLFQWLEYKVGHVQWIDTLRSLASAHISNNFLLSR
jgi:hypothetical protein